MNSIKTYTVFDDEIKKSRFIGILCPISKESDIQNCLQEAKKAYPNATHYCYAAILGDMGDWQRSSDDGEPQRTAGVPILEVLKKHQLTNVIGIIVRYFGGIKLGAGGLIRAYASTTKQTIRQAILTSSVLYQQCVVICPYGTAGGLEYYLHSVAKNVDKLYENNQLKLVFQIKDSEVKKVNDMILKLTQFQTQLTLMKTILVFE